MKNYSNGSCILQNSLKVLKNTYNPKLILPLLRSIFDKYKIYKKNPKKIV
jgi:hypothetical protein